MGRRMAQRGRGSTSRGRNTRGRGSRTRVPNEPTLITEPDNQWDITDTEATTSDIQDTTDILTLFSANASFEHHFKSQETDIKRYLAAVKVLEKNGADIAQSARVRSLAAAWARADSSTVTNLLEIKTLYGLPEILKAVMLLDAGRRCRQLERKLENWQTSKTKVKSKKLGKMKSEIDNLKSLMVKKGSLTKRVCRQVASWVRTQTAEDLEYFAIHMPRDPWKKLADLCHLHPKTDFPTSDWFLSYCFGAQAPEGSIVHTCGTLTANNVNDMIKEFDVPYSHIRQHVRHINLSPESKAKIASYTNLDLILWYYEELGCPGVDQQVLQRLEHGHKITLPLGKLLERLLVLKMTREGIGQTNEEYEWDEQTETLSLKKRKGKATDDELYLKVAAICQKRLNDVVVPIEGPVAVLGDRSGSMDIAIRSSTLLACILSSITAASLVFFNDKAEEMDLDPTDILQVLELAVSIRADRSTAPAVALWHFYEKKEVIKTFIIATDEEENTRYKNVFFSDVYEKYCKEVYPARLVFVSFLNDQHAEGQMVKNLKSRGFEPRQFKFNLTRPDLTKFDKLLGFLSVDSSTFDTQLDEVITAMRGEAEDMVTEATETTEEQPCASGSRDATTTNQDQENVESPAMSTSIVADAESADENQGVDNNEDWIVL